VFLLFHIFATVTLQKEMKVPNLESYKSGVDFDFASEEVGADGSFVPFSELLINKPSIG
jgi:hypothetical protein